MNQRISSYLKLFNYYKNLGTESLNRINEDQIQWKYNDVSNSPAVLVKHMWGNMRSRFTDFLTTDGEKSWRNRDSEFEDDIKSKEELMTKWEEGWHIVFDAFEKLDDASLSDVIYIRNMGHTVEEAIQRQLAHYAHHVGQLVFIAKMLRGNSWTSLSIPLGKSKTYNEQKFDQEKQRKHFTDDYK